MKRALVAVLLVLLATPALAQESVDQAKVYFQAGVQAYDAGEYDVAAVAFEEAYRLVPKPAIAFSMAQAYRRQYFVDRDPAKLKRGVMLYRKYLEEEPRGPRRSDATQHLADMEPLLARVEEEQRRAGMGPVGDVAARGAVTQLMVSSRTPGARAKIDGGDVMEVPVVKEVPPGKHTIQVEAPGHFPESVEGVAVEGRLVVVDVPLRAKPALLSIRAPRGAQIELDGRPVGTAPLRAPVEVDAGRHFVTVSRRGHEPFSRELTLERAQELSLDASLRTTGQRRASYWVLGSAAAFAIGGTTTAVLAWLEQGDAQDLLDKRDGAMNLTSEELAEYNDSIDDRDGFKRASYLMWGGAVALGATGALLYFADNPEVESVPTSGTTPAAEEPAPPPSPDTVGGIVPVVSPDRLGAVFTRQF